MMGYGGGYGGGYGNMMGGTGYGGWLVLLFGALIVAGIVLLVIWAVRASSGGAHHGGPTPSSGIAHDEAVALARKRLATGEITKDQYDEIMSALGGPR
ncbi:MAG: SHOCT domain-containing protein [Coriobacteriia bacterium]|nr:SHOCT domain-containing protein [Coriobacteriia bacterium]